LSTALVLSVLAPTASFAADAGTATKDFFPVKKAFAHHQPFNGEQRQVAKDKMLELVSKYTPESLEEWKNALAEREQLVAELKENAPVQKQRPQLPGEVKEKVTAIREDVKNGNMTREQAREELKNLGLDKLPPHMPKPQLPGEIKEKVTAIREDVKNGNMTREQAREELRNLGIDGGRYLMGDFRKAVEANDEAKIKELLPQLLEQLKERNEILSARLAETN